MSEAKNGPELLDRPEVLQRLFFPRRASAQELTSRYGVNHVIEAAPDISIGCRFYAAGSKAPSVLYFHGNGEMAPDYDYTAPLYQERGINLFVADYRGYGFSTGSPTCSAIIQDAHPVFHGFVAFLKHGGYTGDLFVMGRSLGSAPAIEVAFHHQDRLKGLIVESGFASTRHLLARLGVSHLLADVPDSAGFGNDIKIKEIRIPTLIIHGERDDIIPVAEGRTLLALSGASQKRSLFVPGAGHNDLFEHALDVYMEAVASFTDAGDDAGGV
jgi:pimeloyl-ACP methyl ester carboxylesterase